MKKNIFKVAACVLAVTLVLTSTGTVAFAAEPGAENSGGSSGTTFSFGSIADLRKAAEESAEESIEESVTEESAEESVEETAAEVAEVTVADESAAEESTAKVAVAEEPVAETAVQTYSVQTRSAQTNSIHTYGINTVRSTGSFNFGSISELKGCFSMGSIRDLRDKFKNKTKEPVYVTVSTYYCNCNACFHTTDYNALKMHMFQHVLKGEPNSYHTVVDKILQP